MKKTRDQINRALVKKAQKGSIASRDKLIEDNQNLIYKMASLFSRNSLNSEYDFEEYKQEASITFIKSIYNYDFRGNTKFSSYASSSMKIELSKYKFLSNCRITSNLNVHQIQGYVIKLSRINPNLTDGEIASEIKSNYPISISEKRVREVKELFDLKFTSIDDKMERVIPSDNNNYHEDNRDKIKAIQKLTPSMCSDRDLELFKRRHGLNGYNNQTLKDLGDLFNITKSRAFQINLKIIKNLKELLNTK